MILGNHGACRGVDGVSPLHAQHWQVGSPGWTANGREPWRSRTWRERDRTIMRDTSPATATDSGSAGVRHDKPGGTARRVLRLAAPVAAAARVAADAPVVAVAAARAAALAVPQAWPCITGFGPVRRLLVPRLAGYGGPTHLAL